MTQTEASSQQPQRSPPKFLAQDDLFLLAYQDQKHWSDFNETLSRILIPRVPGSANILKVNQYIQSSFKDLGWTVEEDAFTSNTPHGNKPFRNIIATLNPMACKRLVLACHYDSKDMGVKNGKEFLGATDSAVPCSMMIHLARSLDSALKKRKLTHPSQTTLQMIFFDGEEAFQDWTATDSLYGSRHLANKWNRSPVDSGTPCLDRNVVSELDRIELFVLLDLLGTPAPKFYSFFPETDDSYARMYHLEKNFNRAGLMRTKQGRETKYFTGQRSFGGIEDDHVPFMKKGVKILHIITSPFPSVWHKMTDDERALDHTTIRNLINIFKAFVVEYMHLDLTMMRG